ncbi:MAG: TerC family protein [Actinobacteria bacterium]|nr:TerC family protein [Actinomycetota bacterium]
MLAVDLLLHRQAHEIALREAAIWSSIWVSIGLIAGGVIWWFYGADFGLQYYSGYIIEKSLSVDNVFVWAVIFTFFAVPKQYQHRVLFFGVIGALVLRAIFIAGGSALISSASWVLYIFGAFLIFTGIKMLVQRDSHVDPSKSKTLRLFRRFIPMTDDLVGQRFLVRRNGILMATPLLAVLVVIEVTDVIFAVDSIPAVFAVTSEPFIVFASNAMALLGLRAMYFLLADLMHRFIYLKIGLALVLVWVGIKMVIGHAWFDIPTLVSLGVVVLLLALSVVASLVATRERK